MKKRGTTKEMRAKKREGLRLAITRLIGAMISVTLSVKTVIWLLPNTSLFEEGLVRQELLLVIMMTTLVVAKVVFLIIAAFYALITGMNIGNNGNYYAIDYRLVHYQFSHFREMQDYNERRRTLRLYVVMELNELEMLLQEQWTSVWFKGHAILPIELAIPGRSFPELYVYRSTLKRIAEAARQERWRFVELEFEFTGKDHIGRTSYTWSRLLLSTWDVAKLRTMHQGRPDIRFSDGSAKYLITWEQLEQYEHTLTEAYQILDPQPITVHDNTM